MRELNKFDKKLKEKTTLTQKDFMEAFKDPKVKKIIQMLNNDFYSFRVKRYLYKENKLSAKGFMYNDNIYNLALGKKNEQGDILIDDGILKIFDRFMLSDQIASKGDALTSFMIDHSDHVYNILKKDIESKTKTSLEKYTFEFNKSYNEISTVILDDYITQFLSNNKELMDIAISNHEK
jgi:hypothetical protein